MFKLFVGLPPELVWMKSRKDNTLVPASNRITIPRVSSPLPGLYTHWDIPVPQLRLSFLKFGL